jgi:hypothetical protein
VVRAPLDGEPEVALAAADAAMYRAKHSGGNTVVTGAVHASRVMSTVTSSAAAVPPE